MARSFLVLLLATVLACPISRASQTSQASRTAPSGQSQASEYQSAHFLDRVRNSQEILYAQVLRHYDSLLAARPGALIHIEKCKFIESAFYDGESEENPKQEEWDSCQQTLLSLYPLDARVAAYRLSNLYGDSVLVHGVLAVERAKTGILAGADNPTMASIHRSLAYAYSATEDAKRSLEECFAALKLDDTLPLQMLMAQQWSALEDGPEAREAIMKGEARFQGWEINQAAGILLEQGYWDDAARFYRKNLGDNPSYLADYAGLAKALEHGGEIDSSRKYHVLALEKMYDKGLADKRRFEFDLRYSSGEAALASYRTFRDKGLKVDPFSYHRLRLFFHHPFEGVAPRELGGVALLASMLLFLALAPYLWVLPLHYLGSRWLAKRRAPVPARFTFRHFWICNSALLIIGFVAMMLFQYDGIETAMGLASPLQGREPPSDWENSAFFLAITLLTGAFTLIFCFRTRAAFLFKSEVSLAHSLLYAAGAFLLFMAVRQINVAIFPGMAKETAKEIMNGTVTALLKSNLITLGLFPTLLLVAVVVPIYEEILFRGVFLESVGKYFPFWLVNGLQALAFAALHDSLLLLPTFLAMGLILGWLAKKTGGLLVPILVHLSNNLFATGSLWWLMKRLGKLD